MRYLLEGRVDTRELALAQHGGHGIQRLHLQERLDLVEGLAVGGVSDAETVVGEGAVLVLVGRDVNIAVVEVVVWRVPVAILDVSDALDTVWMARNVLTSCRNRYHGSRLARWDW